MIPVSEIRLHEELFTSFEDGQQITYAVDRIRAAVADQQPILVQLEPQAALQILDNRGIEDHRIHRLMMLTAEEIRDSLSPLVFCEKGDGTWTLIDGSHRYIAMVIKHLSAARAFMVPKSVWINYVVDTPPADEHATINGFSGIF